MAHDPDPDRFLTVARAHTPVLDPSGGLWFASDLAGHPQTFHVAAPLTWPGRVAATSDRRLPVAATPFGLVLRGDRAGDETWELMALEGGDLRRLTSDAAARHLGPVLDPSGQRIGLAYNPGGGVDFALAELDVESGRLRDRLRRPGSWSWEAWSPDGRLAAVTRTLSPTRSEAYLLDGDGGLARLMPEAKLVGQVGWFGERLLATADPDREFLGLFDARSGAPVLEFANADVTAFLPSPDGLRLAVVVAEGVRDRLVVVDTEFRESWRPELPPGTLYSDNVSSGAGQMAWSAGGSSLFVAWETPSRPADIVELSEDAPELSEDAPEPGEDAPARRWTAAGDAAPPGLEPEETSYRSFDGLQVPCLLYRAGDGARPTVVYFHGGPESQSRASYSPFIQLFAARGLNVLLPNVRGSTGLGRTYFGLDDRERRWDSVRDGCEAGRFALREGIASSVAAMGGSYGGFMTLAVLVEEPALWAAAVDIVGIADWHTFFRNTSGWRRALRAAEYGDPDLPGDGEFLARFSPLRRAGEIRAPLLVIHGRNDPRVPVGEAAQIAEATGAELMVFDDEGHGVVRHRNRVAAYGRAAGFLAEHLA